MYLIIKYVLIFRHWWIHQTCYGQYRNFPGICGTTSFSVIPISNIKFLLYSLSCGVSVTLQNSIKAYQNKLWVTQVSFSVGRYWNLALNAPFYFKSENITLMHCPNIYLQSKSSLLLLYSEHFMGKIISRMILNEEKIYKR